MDKCESEKGNVWGYITLNSFGLVFSGPPCITEMARLPVLAHNITY